MPGGYYEEDEWHETDYHRGYGYVQAPPRAPPRRSGDLLAPVADYGSSRRRSRSQGHSPAPNIYVYNSTDVEQHEVAAAPRGRQPVAERDRTGEIVDRLSDIDRDIRRLSRSRGPETRAGPSAYEQQLAMEERYRMREAESARREAEAARIAQMEQERFRLRETEARIAQMEQDRRAQHDWVDRARDDELIRKKYELDRLREKMREEHEENKWDDREKALKAKLKLKEMEDDLKKQQDEQKKKADKERILMEHDKAIAKAKSDREKLLAEIKLKEEEEEEERKALIVAAEAEQAKKRKKQEDEEKAAVARYEQKKRDEKAKEDAMRAKFKAEEEERKRKEKEEEEAWKLKLKMAEEKEKEKEKQRQKELDDELHKKMAVFGFQENQIQAVLNPKKAQDLPVGYSPMNPRPARQSQVAIGWKETPTYIKVSRDHLDVETLKYYGLPYEIDASDSRFVIILQEISEEETQILFEHTRKLRRGSSTLLIEERGRGRDHQYAFVRRRAPSKSPARSKSKARDKSPIHVGLKLF